MCKTKYTQDKMSGLLEKSSRGEDISFTQSLISGIHVADLAEVIANLSQGEKQLETFQSLDNEIKAKIFAELPEAIQSFLLQEIPLEDKKKLFNGLPVDEAIDLLELVEKEKQEYLIATLPKKKQKKFRSLLKYGGECAGGIMTPVLMTVVTDHTAHEVIEIFRSHRTQGLEKSFHSVFVVDENGKLVGVFSLQSLIMADPDTKVVNIMDRSFIAVSVQDDQEVVAQKASKYNLIVVPVVDENGVLVGRITMDDVMEVVQAEADEDAYLMAGIDADENKAQSPFIVAGMRLPWLLTCLCGSLIAGSVISFFSATLSKVEALIFFIPAICAMGGNSGLQTSTITIRNLSYGLVFYKNIRRIIRRELLSGFTVAVVSGLILCLISSLWLGNVFYGLIIGISLLLTITISTCTGVVVPIFFNRVGVDPAIASGPMITTLNDASSVLIYLTIATFLLRWFS